MPKNYSFKKREIGRLLGTIAALGEFKDEGTAANSGSQSALYNDYEADWKQQVAFTFVDTTYQTWGIEQGYSEIGEPIGLTYYCYSRPHWFSANNPGTYSSTSIIDKVKKLTHNNIKGHRLVGVTNVVTEIWNPGTVDSQTPTVTTVTAEWKVKWRLIYK